MTVQSHAGTSNGCDISLKKYHQSREGRAVLSVALLILTSMVVCGAIAAQGALHLGYTGIEPFQFVAKTITANLIPFISVAGGFLVGGIIYVAMFSKAKPTQVVVTHSSTNSSSLVANESGAKKNPGTSILPTSPSAVSQSVIPGEVASDARTTIPTTLAASSPNGGTQTSAAGASEQISQSPSQIGLPLVSISKVTKDSETLTPSISSTTVEQSEISVDVSDSRSKSSPTLTDSSPNGETQTSANGASEQVSMSPSQMGLPLIAKGIGNFVIGPNRKVTQMPLSRNSYFQALFKGLPCGDWQHVLVKPGHTEFSEFICFFKLREKEFTFHDQTSFYSLFMRMEDSNYLAEIFIPTKYKNSVASKLTSFKEVTLSELQDPKREFSPIVSAEMNLCNFKKKMLNSKWIILYIKEDHLIYRQFQTVLDEKQFVFYEPPEKILFVLKDKKLSSNLIGILSSNKGAKRALRERLKSLGYKEIKEENSSSSSSSSSTLMEAPSKKEEVPAPIQVPIIREGEASKKQNITSSPAAKKETAAGSALVQSFASNSTSTSTSTRTKTTGSPAGKKEAMTRSTLVSREVPKNASNSISTSTSTRTKATGLSAEKKEATARSTLVSRETPKNASSSTSVRTSTLAKVVASPMTNRGSKKAHRTPIVSGGHQDKMRARDAEIKVSKIQRKFKIRDVTVNVLFTDPEGIDLNDREYIWSGASTPRFLVKDPSPKRFWSYVEIVPEGPMTPARMNSMEAILHSMKYKKSESL